jgi:sugar phosphate isomerase/epimerase
MKLAIVTDEISQDFSTACELAARWGLRAIEVRTVAGGRVPRIPRQDWGRLRDTAQSFGLEIVSISPGLLKAPPDSPEFAAHTRALADDSFALARVLGVSRLIVFGGVKGEHRASEAPPHGLGDVPDELLEALNSLAERAEAAGATLLLENEAGCYADTGLRTAQIVCQVSRPALRVNWDPGNDYKTSELPFPDGYEHVKASISHVHVKDGVKESGSFRFLPLGEGEIDWLGQLKALRRDGYDGYLVVETHCGPKVAASEKCVQNLEKMLGELEE